jgi:hypothetical protein
MWLKSNSVRFSYLFIPLTILILAFPSFYKTIRTQYLPVIYNMTDSIHQVIEKTSQDAVIWSTWDISNPLMFYTRRKTISDPQWLGSKFFSGERIFYACLPLASKNILFSEHFMRFYIKRGMTGIHEFYSATNNDPIISLPILKSILGSNTKNAHELITELLISKKLNPTRKLTTADDWFYFLFPENTPPIYLLFHLDMIQNPWWFRIGTWDLKLQHGSDALFIPKANTYVMSESLVWDGKKMSNFNLRSDGKIVHQGEDEIYIYDITKFLFRSKNKFYFTDYSLKKGVNLEIYQTETFGAIMDKQFSASSFNKLLIRHDVNDSLFELITEQLPSFQLWKIANKAESN